MDLFQIEKKMIPRLKVVGMILLLFSLIAFSYSFFPQETENEMVSEESLLPEVYDPPPMNMYIVAFVFCSVGTTCMTIAWRKKNAFKTSDSDRR